MSRAARFGPAQFGHAVKLLTEVLKFEHPADAVVSRYFRENRELGHADRGFVAETVYACLRRKRSLEARCGREIDTRRLALVTQVCARGHNLRELDTLLRGGEGAWLSEALALADDALPPAIRLDLPDWLHAALVEQYGAEETEVLARALNQPAPLDIRVNPLKATREALLADLQASGISARPGELSPFALRLAAKPALSRHPRFLDGSFEVQDEGSQLLACLLAPKRGEMVVDFCAGAGGKTLLLGALMKNTGRLYAFDVSDKRLANLKPRLARSGLSNVHPVRIEHERDAKVKRLAGKIDRVLVDAPCSGLGTVRRNPDLKWRQSETAVSELVVKQQSILAAAASLVKPGGVLVYATCSLLAQENDGVVEAFLHDHPAFAQRSAEQVLARQGISVAGERLRLLPHRHQTDGFFAVLLERSA